MNVLLIVLLLTIMSGPVQPIDPEVTTTSGTIRGFTQSVDGRDVKTFLGIPFAEPPIGDLRFRRPVPIQNWNSTLETKKFADACTQAKFTVFVGKPEESGEEAWNPKSNISEDCLYLNIWAPSESDGSQLSTLVWIYGGGFFSGSTDLALYDGKYLAALSNVIVVSIAYRTDTLGFLYLGDELAPGNMGLLDQNLALKWVNENIEKFGGNSTNITLFGESAGAASVHFHMISSLSSHLFQRAIMQSSTGLCHWAFSTPEKAKQKSLNIVKNLNCNKRDVKETVECLKSLNATQLLTSDFIPGTIDGYFLTKSPSSYLNESNTADKDVLIGINTNEYSYFLIYWIYNADMHPNYTFAKDEIRKLIPKLTPNLSFDNRNKFLIDAILQQYDRPPNSKQDKYLDVLDDIEGDNWFKCPVVDFAKEYRQMASQTKSVYLYSFEHRSSSNVWPDWMGVMHGDEIEYVFGIPTDADSNFKNEEIQLSIKMIRYWTHFAKSGNPNGFTTVYNLPHWPEYNNTSHQYIKLHTGQLTTGSRLKYDQCSFWSDYLPKLKKALNEPNRPIYIRCTSDGSRIKFPSLFIVYVVVCIMYMSV